MEPVVITIPACGVKQIHQRHVVRHGFFRLPRFKCDGWTADEYNVYLNLEGERISRIHKIFAPKPHKHNFQYKPSQKHLWVNPDRYVWVCKDQKCDVVISSEKEEFRGALLHKGTTHLIRLPSRRRSWRSN